MKQCTTMIAAHNGQKVQCSRELDHDGEHCADAVVRGATQRVYADGQGFDKDLVGYNTVVTVKPDDNEETCDCCGIKYIKSEYSGDYCAQCSFWISRAKNFKAHRSENITGREDATLVTLGYELYSVCSSDTRGFDGGTFSVGLLGSNETVKIKGPWYGGVVPSHLRDEFKPNVRFVKQEM